MSDDLSLFARAGRYVEGLVLNVIARDSAQLAPQRFTRAAAKRLRAGIRAIEAYLRRLILLIALEIEPTLPRDRPWIERDRKRGRPLPQKGESTRMQVGMDLPNEAARSPCPNAYRRDPRGGWAGGAGGRDQSKMRDRKRSILTFFTGERPFPDFILPCADGGFSRPEEVVARPLLARLSALQNLAKNPVNRARRLAWTLARRRSGFLLAPTGHVPSRYGLELSALFTAMGAAIHARSRNRPPPMGPKPRPPPRIRAL